MVKRFAHSDCYAAFPSSLLDPSLTRNGRNPGNREKAVTGRFWPLAVRHQPSPPVETMLRIIAQRCIPLRFAASRSVNHRLDRVGKTRAPRGSGPSRHLRGYESAFTWITLWFMYQDLCRRLMPRPKFSRSRPATVEAPPATFRLVHLQVVWREQMAIAADIGYGHRLEDAFQGKAHHVSFGCSKARPRYQF